MVVVSNRVVLGVVSDTMVDISVLVRGKVVVPRTQVVGTESVVVEATEVVVAGSNVTVDLRHGISGSGM